MRYLWCAMVSVVLLQACSSQSSTNIKRYSINPWEKEIGYVEVAQVGNSYYISGVACAGENYQIAVNSCYKEIGVILARLHLKPQNIVKETVYARDIEKFKEQIEQRKQFYGNDNYPAATWVQINRLYLEEHLVEIELIVQK